MSTWTHTSVDATEYFVNSFLSLHFRDDFDDAELLTIVRPTIPVH
jgi:hypothetical protein